MYERIVQWAAGPVASLVGIGATALVHQNISHNSALLVGTAIAGAGVTLIAHFKWLDNLAKWWREAGIAPLQPGGPVVTNQAVAARQLREQLKSHGITPNA